MELKHTPGPWYLMQGDGVAFRIGDDADSDRANILCTRYVWEERAEQMLANGRLISAAPDLLEALQGVMDALVRADANNSRESLDLVAIRSAIAKATGSAA